MAESAGKINIGIKMDFSGLRAQMKRVEATISKSVKRIQRAFSSMAAHAKKALLGISAIIVGGFALGIREAIIYENALNRLTQTFIATGGAVGLTTKELIDNAAMLQRISTTSETSALSMQGLLLTFKEIKGDTFIRTTKAVVDMAAGMANMSGQTADVRATVIQLGKALNNPIKGVTALQRVGVEMTKTQKDMIKHFVETGQVAKAQGVILTEIESQFGGLGTEINTTGQALKQLWNSFTDFTRAFGEPFLAPIKRASETMKKFFDENTEKIKKFTSLFTEALSFKFEDKGFAKTFIEVISLFWNIMKIKSISWAKNIGDLLTPVFVGLGKILKDSIFGKISQETMDLRSAQSRRDVELGQKQSIEEQLKIFISEGGNRNEPLGKSFVEMIDIHKKTIERLNKEITDIRNERLKESGFGTFADFRERASLRAKEANTEIKNLFDKFIEGTEAAAKAAKKAADEAARIAAEAKKNAITAEDVKITFTQSGQTELSRLYKGVTSAGTAVALTGQELFGSGRSRISPDARYMGGKIIEVKKAVEKQTQEKVRLENIDTGEGDIPSPAF